MTTHPDHEVARAVRTSRELDDPPASRAPASPDAEARRLRRVHDALRDRDAMPITAADAHAVDRVVAALGASARPAVGLTVRRWSLAAAVVLAAGTVALLWHNAAPTGPGTPLGPGASASADAAQPPLDLAALFDAPAGSDVLLAAAIDRPMLDEADRLRADAARAADALLARLPVRWE